MSFIGGYQSDVNLNDINFVGDFPIDHSIGGFGITTGVNDYLLHLTPAILQYRQGLPLEVRFSQPNTGAVTINVDNRGVKGIKKIVAGVLVNLDAGDLTNDKVYILIYDGVVFQIANSSHLLLDATETRKGISQIATTNEIIDGENDSKIVTPAKLAAYIADKITGLWEDKGVFSCAGNPNYPAGEVGDAYTINIPGKIGGAFGQNVGIRDVLYCNTNNDGGDEENVGFCWTIIQANLEPATDLIAGYLRIANQLEVNVGVNNVTAVSPLKLKTLLDNRSATELLSGLAKLATQADTNAGVDDARIVTPLKLKTLLNTLIVAATEVQAGIAAIASTAEVNAGADNTKFITPAKLAAYVANKITGLWEDKGVINCAGNPNYPAGLVGDAYTVSVAGKIGGAAGVNVQVKDVIYCSSDNAGGSQAAVGGSWNVIQSNLEQATQTIAGFARIATLAEAATGTDDSLIITPLKLASLLMYQAGAGAGSIIPKQGAGNSAPGSFAAVLNGQNNRANGTYSTALGVLADALHFNEWSKAGGGFFNVKGSSQCSILNFLNPIPAGAGVIWGVIPDGAGGGASNRWNPPTNSVTHFLAQFTVTQNSGSAGTVGDTWTGIYEGVVRNVNGVASWLGGAPTLREVRQDAGFSPSVGFVMGGSEVDPFVIGMANRNLHASITMYITQTKFNLS